jgi:hypothetical protein
MKVKRKKLKEKSMAGGLQYNSNNELIKKQTYR